MDQNSAGSTWSKGEEIPMESIARALDEVKEMYWKTLGHPAPEIDPRFYAPFSPGADPVREALEEARQLKRLTETVGAAVAPTWIPRADCFGIEDGYLVQVEIPGVRREDLKVFTVGGEIVVRGVRNPVPAIPEARPLFVERSSGTFERRFALPAGSLVEGMTARYLEGILELKVPVKPAAPVEEKVVHVA
jgi:HSP20 family protein